MSSAFPFVVRGRHGLPAEYVIYHQRARILETTAEVVVAAGIANAPLDRIHQSTGVAKATLYQLYPTREDLVVDAMSHGLSFAVDRVCRAFDAAPSLDAALTASVWALLDAAAADPVWTRFTTIEATGIGPETWRWRDAALAPARKRLRRLMPAGWPPNAPQWGVEAVLAALRPYVLDGKLAATPAIHRELVQLVSAMSGRPAPQAAKRPITARGKTRNVSAVQHISEAFWAVSGNDGIDAVADALDRAMVRRHGPALAHAVRCLVARDDQRDPRFAPFRAPIVEALSRAWMFGTPARNPGPRPYSLSATRLRILEALRELGPSDLDTISRASGHAAGPCFRVLSSLQTSDLVSAMGSSTGSWQITRHGQALLAGVDGEKQLGHVGVPPIDPRSRRA